MQLGAIEPGAVGTKYHGAPQISSPARGGGKTYAKALDLVVAKPPSRVSPLDNAPPTQEWATAEGPGNGWAPITTI